VHRALPLRLGFLVGQNVGWVSGGSGAALGASASLALIHAGFTQDVLKFLEMMVTHHFQFNQGSLDPLRRL